MLCLLLQAQKFERFNYVLSWLQRNGWVADGYNTCWSSEFTIYFIVQVINCDFLTDPVALKHYCTMRNHDEETAKGCLYETTKEMRDTSVCLTPSQAYEVTLKKITELQHLGRSTFQ